MSNTVTIPKKITEKGELVVLPRKEYEALVARGIPTANLTSAEKRALEAARREMARGNYLTLKELEHELGGAHPKKNRKGSRARS